MGGGGVSFCDCRVFFCSLNFTSRNMVHIFFLFFFFPFHRTDRRKGSFAASWSSRNVTRGNRPTFRAHAHSHIRRRLRRRHRICQSRYCTTQFPNRLRPILFPCFI